MAIEEVPIEGSDTQAIDAPEAAPVEAAPAAPAVVARKRGRPKGVANKPKTVQVVEEVAIEPPKEAKAKETKAKEAKAKPAPKKPKKVRVVPPSDSEDEPAPPPKRRKELPPPLDTRHIASEVLQLLSDRHVEKKHAQRQKYASWFQ